MTDGPRAERRYLRGRFCPLRFEKHAFVFCAAESLLKVRGLSWVAPNAGPMLEERAQVLSLHVKYLRETGANPVRPPPL